MDKPITVDQLDDSKRYNYKIRHYNPAWVLNPQPTDCLEFNVNPYDVWSLTMFCKNMQPDDDAWAKKVESTTHIQKLQMLWQNWFEIVAFEEEEKKEL